MGKKEEDITDRINDCLNLLLFDGLIDSDKKAEMSRKLGILFDLPDLLTYADLREIAIHALTQREKPPIPTGKTLLLKRRNPSSCTPTTHGEENVKGVDRSNEAGPVPPSENGGED